MPKCVPMTRSSELRPLTLLLYVVPVTLMELLRRWGSGATSGSGGGGGGGGGGTRTHTHILAMQRKRQRCMKGCGTWVNCTVLSQWSPWSANLAHTKTLYIHSYIWKSRCATHLALCIQESVRSCSGSAPAPHTSAAGRQTARSPVWQECPAPGTRPRSECPHSCCHGNKVKIGQRLPHCSIRGWSCGWSPPLVQETRN